MTALHYILGLTSALCLLHCGVSAAEKTRFSERVPRSPNAPHPIDCELSIWSPWSVCEPCTNERYRTRSVVKFGQYGGKPCLSSLGEIQRCKADKICGELPVDCGNDFECESGRCIKGRLLCNGDNDCGDSSDELCDDGKDPKLVCRNMDIELSEIGRTAGDGFHFFGMDIKRNPFDNEYFNGLCDRVRDGNTKTYYRKPWNVAALVYQTKADKSFTTEVYEDAVELITKIVTERTDEFDVSLTVKVTPSKMNDTTIGGNLGVQSSRSKSIEKVKEYSQKQNKKYLKVSAAVQLGTFQMRTRNIMLSSTFIDDLNGLPSSYQRVEYFAFLEMYGTHYGASGTVGGKYELVYVLDSLVMKSKEITTDIVKNCLGFDAGISVETKGVDASAKVKPSHCNNVKPTSEGTTDQSSVIENVISFVEGGQIELSVGAEGKLDRKTNEIDVQHFTTWAGSLVDSPVILKQKLTPIYTLVPIDLRDAYNKTKNLEKAIEDYVDEFNVCKCQPCQNGGTVLLLDGECMCKCPLEFTGKACETLKKEAKEKPNKPIDGNWGCWTPSSSCINGEESRTRLCNNPAPQPGGRPCQGESRRKVPC